MKKIMTEINKKTGLSPLIEFENEVNVLQELARSRYAYNFPLNSVCIERITSKKYDCFNPMFTVAERMVLKIFIRRAIFGFCKSMEYNFLCRFRFWQNSLFEENGERAEKCLEYFDNLVLMAKKYGLMTVELIEEIKKINRFFKPVRANVKKWKSKC